jgi:predicted nucleic acid-binding protein
MAQAQHEPKGQPHRLTVEFDGWLRARPLTPKEFLEHRLIVLDTNVLLDLYEVGTQARNEILDILRSIKSRLWIPNQVALEFSRRRRQAVLDQMSSYRRVKTDVSTAAASAADVIEAAVDRVRTLRERTAGTTAYLRPATPQSPAAPPRRAPNGGSLTQGYSFIHVHRRRSAFSAGR